MDKIVEELGIPELETNYKRLSQNIKKYTFPNQPEQCIKNIKKQETNLSQEKTHKQKILTPVNLQLSENKYDEIIIGFNKQNSSITLKNQFGYGEAWKKYLLHIEKLLNKGNTVHTKTLADIVGINTRNTRKGIQKLLNKGLITITGVHNNRTITLTENGRKKTIDVKRNISAPS